MITAARWNRRRRRFPSRFSAFRACRLAGDSFVAVADEAKARQVAEYRHSKQRETELVKSSKVSLEELYDQIKTGRREGASRRSQGATCRVPSRP